MGRTIVLNSSNITGTGNNTFVYTFPQGQAAFKEGDQIALSFLSLYYSWNNITNGSNSNFSYKWTDGTSVSVSLPSGFYQVSDLNAYLQSIMYTNNHYLYNTSTGAYLYYIEFAENTVYYSVQLNVYAVPTSLPSGYSLPSGATWSLPGTATTPQVTIPSSASISGIIGFAANTYPSSTQTSTYSTTSTSTPVVTPISSVLVTCDMVKNPWATPQGMIYAFSPDADYGSLITVRPQNIVFNDIFPGTYSSVTIKFWDNSFNPLTIQDSGTVIMLDIEPK